MEIGDKVKHYRTMKSLSIRKLAMLTNLSHSYIADVEKGLKSPSIKSLEAIADGLGLSLSHLLFDEAQYYSSFRWFYNLPVDIQNYLVSADNLQSLELSRFIDMNNIPIESVQYLLMCLMVFANKYASPPAVDTKTLGDADVNMQLVFSQFNKQLINNSK